MAHRRAAPKPGKAQTRITLRILLNHMQKRFGDLEWKISRVDERINSIDHRLSSFEGKVDTLTHRFDILQNNFNTAIPNIDARLDRIEIAIVEQRHEKRIVRLEKHAEFVAKA